MRIKIGSPVSDETERKGGPVALSNAAAESIDSTAIARLAGEQLDWRFKAVPSTSWGATVGEYAASRPPLTSLGTPMLTLDAGALDHNLAAMARWCADSGVDLAPHGKTTMAPALWARQLAAGAWGITLANLTQLRVGRAFGVQRLQLANTLLDPAGLAWVADELRHDPGFDFVSWVDSAHSVELMDSALRAAGSQRPQRPIAVCVELGGAGGRTGCRDTDEAVALARAVVAAPTLRLVGTAGYEGALAHDASSAGLAAVDGFLRRLADLHTRLAGDGFFEGVDDVIITAGGSAYFDQVAEVLGPLARPGVRVVLRSGAYVAHDDGFYRTMSPLSRHGTTTFRSAIHGWARVVSRPEAALALLDGGKRDFPFDEGLPEPQRVVGQTDTAPLHDAKVTALNDQHTFLALAADSTLDVGEVVRVGLSHPCTAFDKWTLIPVIDDADAAEPVVVDFVRTFF
jgi:D-serine deaminase-like pyridoxal phosphate-dependent protein